MTDPPHICGASDQRRRRRTVLVVAATAASGLLFFLGAWSLGGMGRNGSQGQRQEEVAARGSQVMPFDLAKTTHVFTDRDDGGVQTVTADDPGDATQVGLIRTHLREEEAKFTKGDFGDPTTIHGSAMPGLKELQAAGDRVQVRYEETADGARLWYSTADPSLVDALHAWFKAQSSDHRSEHHPT